MQVQLVDVLCDTSFLIHFANNRIKNIVQLDIEFAQMKFLVPTVVIAELENLLNDPSKKHSIISTLDFIKQFKTISIDGKFADDSMIKYLQNNRVIIATMDKELKTQIRKNSGSIMSFSNNKIVLE